MHVTFMTQPFPQLPLRGRITETVTAAATSFLTIWDAKTKASYFVQAPQDAAETFEPGAFVTLTPAADKAAATLEAVPYTQLSWTECWQMIARRF